MNLHANGRTCPYPRFLFCRRVIEAGWRVREAAEAAGCSARTVCTWLGRYRVGDRDLLDRSWRPLRSPLRLPQRRVEAVERLRRLAGTPTGSRAERPAQPGTSICTW